MPKEQEKEKIYEKKEKEPVKAYFHEGIVLTEDSDPARELYALNRFGGVHQKKVELSLIEALYLFEKEKIRIFSGKKPISYDDFLKKAQKKEKNFFTRYKVFKDMRERGYIVKTALKFGADFRVYDRGVKPGEDHAKWVLYPVNESEVMTWYDFAAKNRVAHSTKKRLLIGIADSEGDVTYYEIKWTRP
jgi:tRNA-intron endonuclease